jgi:hypothetical protein
MLGRRVLALHRRHRAAGRKGMSGRDLLGLRVVRQLTHVRHGLG